MPTRDQIHALVEQGLNYSEIGVRVGVPPGQAYLIDTGTPADGTWPAPSQPWGAGRLGSRAQQLVIGREVNPTGRSDVLAWMARQAYGDASMRHPVPAKHAGPSTNAEPSQKPEPSQSPEAAA